MGCAGWSGADAMGKNVDAWRSSYAFMIHTLAVSFINRAVLAQDTVATDAS
jgi:hypothetical protein